MSINFVPQSFIPLEGKKTFSSTNLILVIGGLQINWQKTDWQEKRQSWFVYIGAKEEVAFKQLELRIYLNKKGH